MITRETFIEADRSGHVRMVEVELTISEDGSGSVREVPRGEAE